MKTKNRITIALLFISLIIPIAGYAQSKTANRENKSNRKEQAEYLTETYRFTRNNFKEYELRKQIEDLPGVIAVQVNNGSSTVVVKFDKSLNSKKKLKKSFTKIGVPGDFEDSSKTKRRESSTRETSGRDSNGRSEASENNTRR
ncbi:hypothetical protein [Dysgonomonas sp. GY617]|uniref:hypothetical protein n=1 Tax=Dysgonomonas sp. GY617 TaxID=2780420 RepID=UPI001883494D|nr:hypothetical protein [Dysgonomonas sp. GY617]MBF0574477.1 hypothetical protein [Dysgonomonas sp. GY617]